VGRGGEDREVMSGRLKRLTIAEAAMSVFLYDSGFSLQNVATFFGVTRQGMHDLLKRRTIMRPQQRHGSDNHFYRGGPIARDNAQNVLEKAVERGDVIPYPCEICGSDYLFADGRRGTQAHHDDYAKPLAVRWLCQKHHHEWHRDNVAEFYHVNGVPE
jgi:hypothetical protein